jgi:uncharacterized damage-inducible protein DinB
MKQLLMLAALVAVTVIPAQAQQAPKSSAAGDAAMLLTGGLNEVANYVLKSAEMVPAEKYSYKPTPAVRSFGQLIAHVADGQNWYCSAVAGKNAQWSDAVEKGPLDKATLIAKLKQSTDGCRAAYKATGLMKPMMENVGHDNLHYGNIITYLRMLGLTPPSS